MQIQNRLLGAQLLQNLYHLVKRQKQRHQQLSLVRLRKLQLVPKQLNQRLKIQLPHRQKTPRSNLDSARNFPKLLLVQKQRRLQHQMRLLIKEE